MTGRYAPRVLVCASFIIVALMWAWPLPLHMGTLLTGEPSGDTGVYVWNQWVFHEELSQAGHPLSTSKILSLTPRVDLSQHNYTVFLDLLAYPLIAWIGVIAAFNTVFLMMTVLNALLAYGLARRAMGAGRWESWLAGLAFAWSPVLTARGTGHFSLMAAAPLAAFLWALITAERSRRRRDAAIVGVCMAWAALSDAYFGVYCLMIAAFYIVAIVVRVSRAPQPTRLPWVWLIDVLLITVSGLIAGMLLGMRGVVTVLGVTVGIRELYTPVLILTLLAIVRAATHFQPRVIALARFQPRAVTLGLIGMLACAGPLSPVLIGLGQRAAEGRLVSPKVFWRSSPGGVDLLSFVSPNPNHPLVRWLFGDWQAAAPAQFVEQVAALSLVALALIAAAVWRAGFRPRAGWWWVTGGFAALALGPFIQVAGYNSHVPGPWSLLRYVPVIGWARTPARFAIVATLGVAVLMTGALVAIGRRWPERRRLMLATVTVLLAFELWPAPRPLYSAAISPVFDTIAADPRPVRVITLPFGVRDGTFSIGNFSARSQFNQTRHGKALIGGYLSRISEKRVERMRTDFPTLAVLMRLSEPRPLEPRDLDVLRERGAEFVRRVALGYVVVDRQFITEDAAAPVVAAFGLTEIQRDGDLILYAAPPPR